MPVLWQGDGWEIKKEPDGRGDVYAMHLLCDLSKNSDCSDHSYYLMDDSYYHEEGRVVAICYGCGCAVPESVITLMTLYEE